MKQIAVIAVLLLPLSGFSETRQGFHAEVQRLYAFEPHNATKSQINAQSERLDAFWRQVKAEHAVLIPALATELQDKSNPSFFYYDGSKLLLSIADTAENREVAAQAFARVDLRDIDPTDYFYSVHTIASTGGDATSAALHILDDPAFKVIVPQHALTLGQNYSLVYLLLVERPELWLEATKARLAVERDAAAQKSILLALWYSQTDTADELIKNALDASELTPEARAWAAQLLNRSASFEKKRKAVGTLPLESDLKVQRRLRMKAVSDEALEDLDELTLKIYLARHPARQN
jgi:hypothetical protein